MAVPEADEHAKLAPSFSKAWMECSGCIRMVDQVYATSGVPPSSVEAERGSTAHEVGDYCLSNGYFTVLDCLDLMGADIFYKVVRPERTQYLCQEMYDYVQLYLDTVIKGCGTDLTYFQAESKLDMSWLVPNCWGTVDAMFYGDVGGTLKIWDLKYGMMLVEIQDLPAVKLYAIGAIGEGNPNNYQYVEVTVVQPRPYHVEGPVRSMTLKVEDLLNWGAWMGTKALETEDPLAPLTPGDHCQSAFCDALPVCPEVTLHIAELAKIDFTSLEDIAMIANGTPAGLDILSDSDVTAILEFSKVIIKWHGGLEDHVFARKQAGSANFPDFKLVRGRGSRSFRDPIEMQQVLSGLGEAIYTERKLRTPAQIEKIPGVDKNALTPYISKFPGRVMLAPVGDPRPPVSAEVVADFSAVPSTFIPETVKDDFLF